MIANSLSGRVCCPEVRDDSLDATFFEQQAAPTRPGVSGVVPLPVEIEVAVQPTPRGFSGLIPEGTAYEEHCQEDTASGRYTAAASRHSGGARAGSGQCTARTRATAPGPRAAPGVRDQRRDGCAGWSA